MSLVSSIIVDADGLEELYFLSAGNIIQLQLEKKQIKIRGIEPKTVIQSQFNILFEPKITVIAKMNGTRYEVEINFDKYRNKYHLRLILNDDEEIEVYANYI